MHSSASIMQSLSRCISLRNQANTLFLRLRTWLPGTSCPEKRLAQMRATTENSKRESAHGYPGAIGTSLCQYSAGLDGHLFTTVNGRLLDQRNVLDGLHGAGKRSGFHVFRRFRFCCAPKGWCAGPLNQAVDGPTRLADRYAAQLYEDVAYRREWC